jgi:hypothetical protein
MVNAWSFLYDEMKMTESLGEDNYSDMLNLGTHLPGAASPDTITFTSTEYDGLDLGDPGPFAAQPVPYDSFMGVGEDHISFNLDMTTTSNNPNRFKYSEERILKELTDYISATYNQHYSAGDDKVQTLDLIEACGDGESFCRSNILKYASRYDKKGTARRDIMKILHYAVLLMHFNDKNAQRETYNQ